MSKILQNLASISLKNSILIYPVVGEIKPAVKIGTHLQKRMRAGQLFNKLMLKK
jgi:hypothetical protein